MNYDQPDDILGAMIDLAVEQRGEAESTPTDSFKQDSRLSADVLIPKVKDLRYLTVNGHQVKAPDCLVGSVVVKALYVSLHHNGLRIETAYQNLKIVERVFNEMVSIPRESITRDERFTLQLISNAIKDTPDMTDSVAYPRQSVFLAAVRLVAKARKYFTLSEQKRAREMLKHVTVFQPVKSDPRSSIASLCSDYSDTHYTESVRMLAFMVHRIWSRVRHNFEIQMPKERTELIELLRDKKVAEICREFTPGLNSKLKKQSPELYASVQRIRHIMLLAAEVLNDRCLIESLFVSTVYNKAGLEELTLDQNADHLSLKDTVNFRNSDVDLTRSGMMRLLNLWHFGQDGKPRAQLLLAQSYRFLGAFISPFHLLVPWGDEIALSAALILTERAPSSALPTLVLDQIRYFDRQAVRADRAYATRLAITETPKGRQGKTGDTDLYDKSSDFFKVFDELKRRYTGAVTEGWLTPDYNAPFMPFFGAKGAAKNCFLAMGLGQKALATSVLAPFVVNGCKAHTLIKRTQRVAFHCLVIQASQRLATNKGARPKNPSLPVWPTKEFLPATTISQSRVYADKEHSLRSGATVSDNMDLKIAKGYYDAQAVEAENSFHSLETRMNTYFSRAQTKVVIESEQRFAAQVGNEMVKSAIAMLETMAQSTRLLDLGSAKAALGLAEFKGELTPELIIEKESVKGSLINDTAFIQPAGERTTYVIETELHAMLMIAKLEHIDQGLDELLLSNPYLVPKAIARRMLIAALLLKFQQSTVSGARQKWARIKLSAHPITFPSLVATLGSDI